MLALLVVFILGMASGVFAEMIASAKGYKPGWWFAAGFFFSIFAILGIGFMPDKNKIELLEEGLELQRKSLERMNMLLEAELHKKRERDAMVEGNFGIE